LLIAAIYASLIAGAVTMLYPFLLMIAGSTRSAVDLRSVELVPRFFHDDLALYRKHIEGLFNESPDAMNIAYGTDFPSFEAVTPPMYVNRVLVEEWEAFLQAQPPPEYAGTCGYLQAGVSRTVPRALREFKGEMAGRFDSDVSALNREMGTEFVGWKAFFVMPPNILARRGVVPDTPFYRAVGSFAQEQPLGMRYYFSVDGFYKRLFLKTQYTKDIEEYNRAHGTSYGSYAEVQLSRTLPDGTPAERKDWEEFVRYSLNLHWVRVDPAVRSLYQSWLRSRYGRIEELNESYGASYAAFVAIPLMETPPAAGAALSDWEAFITERRDGQAEAPYLVPATLLRIHSLEFQFRDALEANYGSIDALNAAAGTSYRDFMDVPMPQRDLHYVEFLDMRRDLRWEFATRNYKAVIDYMVVHGRGVVNTAIYCLLAVGLALLVNPLAAYALSRYRMPATYKVLLFLMLTMAFPPMVTQIPVFLMLRELGLLNTFAALVLPGLANGYLIFLLKGFFDAQPRELYECAQLDGAGEWTLFWQITMSLAKPILSVIALGAFVAAYSNFMFALLICQDEKMWTLMVWLYQLQQRSGPAVVYASLLIAAVPTFIVFIFCQKIILRGIIVPVEK
jgi:multiple sugar transport system permease protein